MSEASFGDAPRILTPEQAQDIVIVGGSTYPEQAQEAARFIGTEVGGLALKVFPNSELHNRFEDSVRGKRVFIVQTDYETEVEFKGTVRPWSVNDSIQQALLMTDAAVRASAKEVTLVKPYLGYSRQDRETEGREPVSVHLHLEQCLVAGADRLVTIDLHSPQAASVYKKCDNVPAVKDLCDELKLYADEHNMDLTDAVFVAPDNGSLALPNYYQRYFGGGEVRAMQKTHVENGGVSHHTDRLGGFGGKTVVLVDDMVDTAGTLVSAVEILHRSGADKVIVSATHGLFSDKALKRLEGAEIDQIIVTDTVPQKLSREVLGSKLTVRDVSPLLGKTIFEIAVDGSVSSIYEKGQQYRR